MPQLPLEIENLIWYYIGEFQIVTSWPKMKSVRRLVNKTNHDIIARYFGLIAQHEDMATDWTLVIYDVDSILNSPFHCAKLMEAIDQSIRFYPLTSAMKWTFFDKGLYKIPRYFNIFQHSILFNVIQHTLIMTDS